MLIIENAHIINNKVRSFVKSSEILQDLKKELAKIQLMV